MSTLTLTQESSHLVSPVGAEHPELPAIQAAMRDYAQGWYNGDSAQMRRALHPALAKRALLPTETDAMQLSEYPAEALIARVGRNQPEDFASAAKASRVTVFAIHGITATGLLEMDGWTDFMHLVKADGAWQVLNILWEPDQEG